jgi:type IV secretion system protein VirD4
VTISVTNNQMPLMPLFSPVYTSTRPYSQTRSNTQRDLMQPDEVLRLDQGKCIVLFQGHKPALLYKLMPEELPDYPHLKSRRIIDYTPSWKQREAEEVHRKKEKQSPQTAPPPVEKEPSPAHPSSYNITDFQPPRPKGLGMREYACTEKDIQSVLGEEPDEEEEQHNSPPRR